MRQLRLAFWLNYKYGGTFVLNRSSALAALGVVLAVASLVVSMSVVNGYFNTLKKTVVDSMGHMVVLTHGLAPAQALKHKDVLASTLFWSVEAVASSSKHISGVLVEGVDTDTFDKVLNYQARLQTGQLNLQGPHALVGKQLARQLQLKVGDSLRLVVPQTGGARLGGTHDTATTTTSDTTSDTYDTAATSDTTNNTHDTVTKGGGMSVALADPYVGTVQISGLLDLGRHDYNSRYVIVNRRHLQTFVPRGVGQQGVRWRLKKAEDALILSDKLLTMGYNTYNWQDANRNLFQAAVLEKKVLFFILLVLMLAASFNVSSTLYVNVMHRWRDMSVMKVLGARPRFLWLLFSIQALVIACIGLVFGFAAGGLAGQSFMWAQKKFQILPGQVYKLDYVQTSLAWGDAFSIVVATVLICWLAALWPAYRGARMLAVRALSYE